MQNQIRKERGKKKIQADNSKEIRELACLKKNNYGLI